jgi:hypothetical protein
MKFVSMYYTTLQTFYSDMAKDCTKLGLSPFLLHIIFLQN